MDEYVKRGSALESLCIACEVVPIDEKENCPYRFAGCQEYANIIEIPAADVVEIVRCKDCRFYYAWPDDFKTCHYFYEIDGASKITGAEDYCSQGERKKDA